MFNCVVLDLFMAENIGSRIEKARKSKGITQTALGEMLGVSQQSVAAIEKRATIPKQIVEIARVLGVSYDFLVSGESKPQAQTQLDDNEQFTAEQISRTLPVAFERTIVAMSKYYQSNNGQKLDIFEHKEEISDFLSKSLIGELTGDYTKFAESFDSLKTKIGKAN